ncbi:MFS transporter [Niallia oryzisoli]|uniref:MFS transporter n=1 Tax=Niallia oryzisoli TaxID=1737571 RepID=A0ABZ2C785_9BACI
MTKPKQWTKDFILISLNNFFTHIVFYILMVTIALYVTKEFSASPSMAGLSIGIFVLASLAARIFAGKYMDRIGRKRAMIVALIVFVVAMFLHLQVNHFVLFMLIRVIHGASHGFITTIAGAIAADLIPNERRGEGTGYYTTSMNLAMAIGPFIGLYVIEHASFHIILLIGTVVAVIDFIISLFLKVPEVNSIHDTKITKWHWKDFIEPRALPISTILLIITLGYASLLSYLSLYAREIDLVEISSYFFMVYAAALLVSRPFTGKWFDKYGENKVTYPLIICLAIGFILLSQTQNALVFLLSGALIGIGYGTVLSNFQAIAIQQSPSNRKALATSTFFMFLDLANGIGPYLIGILIGFMSLQHLYLSVAIWMLLCMGFYFFAHGKKASIKSPVEEKMVEQNG